jgi:hypothetical protein
VKEFGGGVGVDDDTAVNNIYWIGPGKHVGPGKR